MAEYWVEWSGGQVLNMKINMGRVLVKISTRRSRRPNRVATFLIREESWLLSR